MSEEILPPFSGDDTTCPKCSHQGAATSHRAAGEHGPGDLRTVSPSSKGERLERECWRCDFAWEEALNPPQEPSLGERVEVAEREATAARKFAEEMRNFCSPHGVSVHYADQLVEAMDRAKAGRA